MATSTITSKGQVTIPKTIRRSLMLKTGDKIEFIISENNELLVKPISKKVDDVFGRLHDPSRQAISIEDIDSALKRKMKEKY